MCDSREVIDHVSLVSCTHGNYHLHLGKMTLHLTRRELKLLVRAAAAWVETSGDEEAAATPSQTHNHPQRHLPWQE